MGRLSGRRTLVTGAGSGLGRATARRFAAEGASVACCDIDGAAAAGTAEAIRVEGGESIAVTVDVTEERTVDAMMDSAVAAFGGVDVVFANAGVAGSGRAGDLSMEAWQRVIGVNLTGVWLTARAAVRRMHAQGAGGSIVCTASVGGLVGVPGIAAYAAAKAGVIGLVRQMAVDYGPDGIRVNAIAPGTVPTPLVRRTYAEGASAAAQFSGSVDEVLAASIGRFPLGRLGEERDVAEAALYLASDDSSWVTGHALVVDGGMTAQ